jgi:hypothetical protein
MKKIREAETEFAKLNLIKEREFTSAMEETSRLFVEPPKTVCQHLKDQVEQCYKVSGNAPLNCFPVIQEFFNCVTTARGMSHNKHHRHHHQQDA